MRGSVVVEVAGAFPERVFNLCAARGVPFWALRWQDKNTVRFKTHRADARRIPALAQQVGCTCKTVRPEGLPAFLARFRRRYALLIGLALSLAAVCVLSHFVLTIDVSGNERLTSAAILTELHRHGVRAGVFGPGLDTRAIANEILLDLPDLAWMSVNLHGTRAEVLVAERDPKPAIEDEITPASIVSGAAGIITRIDVLRGQAVLQRGDTVLPGEVLITGVVDLREPAYSETDLGVMVVNAAGNVEARTWRTLTACAPVEAQTKTLTGRERSYFSIQIFGHRFNFYTNAGIPYAECDKIKDTWAVTLPSGQLPFALTRETVREYTTAPAAVDTGRAEIVLRQALERRLLDVVNGQIIRVDFQTTQADGLMTVTLLAECLEDIGVKVPLAGSAPERK